MPSTYFAVVHPETGAAHVRGSKDDYGYKYAAVSASGAWASFSKDAAAAWAGRYSPDCRVAPVLVVDAKTARAIKATGRMPVEAAPAQAEPVAQAAPAPASTVETVRAAAPTAEVYGAFQAAFDHFNARLFAGSLPACLVTLQRKDHRTMGYYSPNRFVAPGGETVDEIAMNPQHFGAIPETLSTLAHEMAHLWQEHHGKPSRKGYHNEEWATKMDAIGLAPRSSDGKGARTGQKMSHEIVEGGAFDVACRDLLADAAFALRWREVTGATAAKEPKKPTRAKFCCPTCDAAAWAKPSARLICGDCEEVMKAEGDEEEAEAEAD